MIAAQDKSVDTFAYYTAPDRRASLVVPAPNPLVHGWRDSPRKGGFGQPHTTKALGRELEVPREERQPGDERQTPMEDLVRTLRKRGVSVEANWPDG